jgi:hypothetical protein
MIDGFNVSVLKVSSLRRAAEVQSRHSRPRFQTITWHGLRIGSDLKTDEGQ